MSLHLTPAAAEAAWLEPPEYDDPLDGVEFPRERKPWKRDRERIRSQAQGAINRRCWANVDANGQTLDHSMGQRMFNHALYEVSRARWEMAHMHPIVRADHIARLKRYILAVRRYAKPPLPSPSNERSVEPRDYDGSLGWLSI